MTPAKKAAASQKISQSYYRIAAGFPVCSDTIA
jgi:hypothetical protein